jgi:hypothetical protein
LKGEFKIKEYSIIKDDIVEDVDSSANKTADALNNMSPLLANKVLENLTINEIRALASLKKIDGGDLAPNAMPTTPTI